MEACLSSKDALLPFFNLSKCAYTETTENKDTRTWSCTCSAEGQSAFVATDYHLLGFDDSNAFLAYIVKPNTTLDCLPPDTCVVAVRGTDGGLHNTNWFVDILAEKDVNDLHHGFNEAAEALLPGVGKILSKYNCKNVVTTGHSLGGAASLALALHLKPDFDVKACVTFEAPRLIGTQRADIWRKNPELPVVRVTNRNDPVPHLPPCSASFEHVGTEVYYGKDGSKTVRTEPDECKDSSPYVWDYSVTDHCTFNNGDLTGSICYDDCK